MFRVPVTFLFDFEFTDERTRPYVMHEFAVNGAKHLVLTDTLISMILQRLELAGRLQKEMAAEGLSFVDSHAPFGPSRDLNCPVKSQRREMILRHKAVLEIVAAMGVDTITIHVGNNTSPEYPFQTHVANIEEALAELLPDAERLGLTICIENIWFQCSMPEVLLGIKEKFPTDALGFCYDSGHANLMDRGRDYENGYICQVWKALGIEPPPWEDRALEKMLPNVVNCHLHDNDGSGDQHRLPGHGNIDWPHIIGLLNRAPRLKNIQSEVIPVRTNESIRDICETFLRFGETV